MDKKSKTKQSESQCQVCKENILIVSDPMVRLQCGHEFHLDCGLSFLSYTHMCIVCDNKLLLFVQAKDLEEKKKIATSMKSTLPVDFGDNQMLKSILSFGVEQQSAVSEKESNKDTGTALLIKCLKEKDLKKKFRATVVYDADLRIEDFIEYQFTLADIVELISDCSIEFLVSIGLEKQHLTRLRDSFCPDFSVFKKMKQFDWKSGLPQICKKKITIQTIFVEMKFALHDFFALGGDVADLVQLGLDAEWIQSLQSFENNIECNDDNDEYENDLSRNLYSDSDYCQMLIENGMTLHIFALLNLNKSQPKIFKTLKSMLSNKNN